MSMALAYYLIAITSNLTNILGFMGFMTGTGSFLGIVVRLFMQNEVRENTYKIWSKALNVFIVLFIVCGVANSLIPSKRDMMIVAGLHIGEKGVEKVLEEAGQFYPLLKDVIKNKLLELKEETTPKKGEKDASKS